MYNKKTVENKRGPNKKKAGNKITNYMKAIDCPEDQVVDPSTTDIDSEGQQSNVETESNNSK